LAIRKNIKIVFLFSSLMIISLKSYGWNHVGHQIVAEIAYSRMPGNIKDSVNKYLDNITLEKASTWMDEVKDEHKYRYLKPLHYIHIPRNMDYQSVQGEKNCVSELKKVIKRLHQKSKLSHKKINLDLKILIHLVGEIHQPLHAGYTEDKGGIDLQVRFLGKNTNLHEVWDSEIIKSGNISTAECIKKFSGLKHIEISEIEKVDILKWLSESRSLLGDVYDFQGEKISKSYIAKNTDTIEKQLFKAGVRLNEVLVEVFSK